MAGYREIVWVASYPKSGNTWVRMFLDAYFLGDCDINDVTCSVTDSIASRNLTGDGSDPTAYPIDIQQLTRGMALLRLVQQYEKNKVDGMPLFVKTHNAHLLTNGSEWLPHSLTKAVIHIVRDPRDVLPSFSEHMGFGDDYDAAIVKMEDKLNTLATKGAASMADFISSWKFHTQAFLDSDTHNILTLRYEDMKAAPVESFCKILDHAGVSPDRARVAKALEIVNLDRLARQESESGFLEASPKAGKQFFGAKHKPIEPRHRHRIEKVCGRLMKRLGYMSVARAA